MSTITELEDKVKELMEEIETLKQEKKNEEFEYSFKNGEEYWVLRHDGHVSDYIWDGSNFDKTRYSQGNMFKTEEAAAKERDRRLLLTRFRQFRDKCNGDWKPDWEGWEANKYYLAYSYLSDTVCCFVALLNTAFQPFGYFKNRTDCERAIELFGDEIKRLYVED